VVRDLSCGNLHIYLELEVRRVDCGACGTVKRERLTWLADNPFYTKRFAFFVGRRCRAATIKDVAKELHLDWHSVKELEKQYMREQLRRVGTPGPKVIGIDEISIRKGHTYRIVVSDLLRRRPIWFGGTDRSQASLELFFKELVGQLWVSRTSLGAICHWLIRKTTLQHREQLQRFPARDGLKYS
jgi:transposase